MSSRPAWSWGAAHWLRFDCRRNPNGTVLPKITGQAYVGAETKLMFNSADPLKIGPQAEVPSVAGPRSIMSPVTLRGIA